MPGEAGRAQTRPGHPTLGKVRDVEIIVGDPASAEVRTVLRRHLDFARSHAPEAVFALDADDLADPAVRVLRTAGERSSPSGRYGSWTRRTES